MMAKAKVDEKVYEHVKILQKSGASYKKISELVDLAQCTVMRIAHSDSFDGYREFVRENSRLASGKKPEDKPEERKPEDLKLPGGTLSNAYMMNRIIRLLEDQNKTLELISNKMAFIVEQLS